jgi:hypothetical protein
MIFISVFISYYLFYLFHFIYLFINLFINVFIYFWFYGVPTQFSSYGAKTYLTSGVTNLKEHQS